MNDIVTEIKNASLGKTYLFYLGQAGFALKSKAGKLLAVDLYLSDCVSRYDGFKRLIPFMLDPSEITFDYIIATHAHYDHFDPDSIPGLMGNPKTRLLASIGCECEIIKLGISNSNITYVKVGDRFDYDDIKIQFVFCDHGVSAPDALGLIIEIDGKSIYITGDTCLRLDKANDIKCGQEIDIMITPINGTFGNLNEIDSIKLCKVVSPKLMIPCHFGCFAEQWGNPLKFAEEIKVRLPEQMYAMMRFGEKMEI